MEIEAPVRANLVSGGMGRSSLTTRDRILDAASAVAQLSGPAHLSLDAVAEQAGVSKGGLLYHFPTKQALISAVIERYLANAERAAGLSDGAEIDGNTLALSLLAACCPPEKRKGGGRNFLAAIAEDPVLLEPVRQHQRRIVDKLRHAAAPEVALIAFLVVEGIRSLELFDLNPLSDGESEALLARLSDILRRPVEPAVEAAE